MTPVALYLNVSRVTLFVSGSVLIWMAAFLVVCWLLHFEPRQVEPVLKSRRELIVSTTVLTAIGVTTLVLTVTGAFDYTIMKHKPVFGCTTSQVAISSLAFSWISIVELRRAFRLRRQRFRQLTGEQPRAISDQ